ncbi:hypothetical protein CAEBREN_16617 [Caenorhabditis brenneri]|uniref:F-box domain-containing protein n=1 Tax=Caenorhabditis brenneri TaxID=135651 RepID=G0N691_CAEBE|nr:hypothetical protein CAEBREN_16617 [Caenorhabditis brenneri]
MVFPLRCLPLLAAIKVIKSLDVEDFISFIRMSPRMKNLVKLSKVHIHLIVFGDTNIGFQKLSDPGRTKWVQLFLEPNSSEKQTNLPFEPSVHQKSMPTFEENLEEYRRKMNEFVDMFTVTCADFDMRGVPSYICMQYLEYATNFGIKLKKVLVFISDEHGVDCGRDVLRDRKFEIERADGMKANICCYGTRFSIGDAELFY